MIWILRVLVFAIGCFMTGMGLTALLQPHMVTEIFAIAPQNAQGWATIRGDLGSFFLSSGIFVFVGLFYGARSFLYSAALLIGLVFTGRTVSLMLDGQTDQTYSGLAVEGLFVLVLVAYAALKPHR